ncbi:MAG: hypothetical protein IJQ93_01585 [Bacteroidales bacterium]|nr:hypothetical protein [Bacteroidales bacterium]
MKTKSILLALVFLAAALTARAQEQPLTPEQQEKKMRENIEEMVLRYEESLSLEVWQTFYVDSILTHNFNAMSAEMKELSMNRVENVDIYTLVRDKWEEETYKAFSKILDENQWAAYLKTGAARAKKARDKRALKREGKK